MDTPDKTFILLGPRGTGKSTWIEAVIQPDLKIDLLIQKEFLKYSANPSALLESCKKLKAGSWVVIDEIQKIPSLMDEAHHLYESKKINFALTGSSARKLKRGQANLMGGRALQRLMFPFVYSEYEGNWTIDQALLLGTLPLVVTDEKNAEETLFSYVTTYLKEELMEEGFLRKLEPFARFLNIASSHNAQILNVENISRESSVKRTTVDSYLSILSDTLIATQIEALRLGYKAKEVSHPKLYFFDAGIARACAQISTDDFDSVQKGFSLETLVLGEIRAYLAYAKKNFQIFHYHLSGSYDVDFVVEVRPKSISKKRKLLLIEVKNSTKAHLKWADPILDLRNYRQIEVENAFILYRGKEHLDLKGIPCIPVDHFFKNVSDYFS